MKILVTGSTGRLGSYLVPILKEKHEVIETGRRNHYDITYPLPPEECDLVIHLAAYTNVVRAEKEAQNCMDTNVKGTFNVVEAYKNTPIIHISTEYANKPIGVYALTKYLGEEIVKHHPNHLILRTSFKPTPWPFPFAYENQHTQGDYVNVIAEMLAEVVETWDRKSDMRLFGTGRKTMFELARRTRPDVKPNRVEEYNQKIGMNLIPCDYI